MNTTVKIFFLFVLLLAINACKSDEPVPALPMPDPCAGAYEQRSTIFDTSKYFKGDESLVFGHCAVGPRSRRGAKWSFGIPVLNPNNNKQFCYIASEKDKDYPDGSNMYKYDFCTGTSTFVTSNWWYGASWSVKDWIIFTAPDLQLWKVKSNGDSLIQLTNTRNYNNYAVWSPRGDKYLYFDASLGSTAMVVSNETGQKLKVFNKYMERWTWLNDSVIVYIATSASNQAAIVRKYFLNSDTDVLITEYNSSNAAGAAGIYVKDNIIYTTDVDYTYKITDNSTTVIDKQYRSFLGFSLQPLDNNKYLIGRNYVDTSDARICIRYSFSEIHILNKNNNTERRVNIPE
jgi:hypothetical protein